MDNLQPIDEEDVDGAVSEELIRLNTLLKMFRAGRCGFYRDGPGYILDTWEREGTGWVEISSLYDTLPELTEAIQRAINRTQEEAFLSEPKKL